MGTTWWWLAGAGLVAGVSGTVTGVGSVFSYPALLATGLPATAANVTNTVALAIGGVGGALGSRPDLADRAPTLWRLGVACAAGSAVGSALLLVSPPGVVELVVPFLVAAASLSVLLPRRPRDAGAPETGRGTVPAMVAVSVYNGYFAAAGGVLIAAVLLWTTASPLVRAGAMRNVLVLVADAVAAAGFAVFGQVSWADVAPLVVGLFAGTLVGPAVARRTPVVVLRWLIAAFGLGLAVALGTGVM